MSQILQTIRRYGPEITQKYKFPVADIKVSVFKNLPEMQLDEAAKGLTVTDLSTIHALTSEKDSVGREINNLSDMLRQKKEQLQRVQRQLEAASDIEKSLDIKKKELQRILETLAIKHVEFIRPGVTIFTTEMLKINDDILGIFRIWIDWNAPNFRDAIRVVNVYHRNCGHDHPCISGGGICMGNAEEAFRQNFQKRDVYALVESIVSFLISPNVSHGYITRWPDFFEDCEKVRPNFDMQEVIHRSPFPARENGRVLSNDEIERMFRGVVGQAIGSADFVRAYHALSFNDEVPF